MQKLTQDLKAAQARIKALEKDLNTATNASHPLLQGSEAQAKPSVTAAEPGYEELYEDRLHEATETMGSLLLGSDGRARHLGESATSAVGISDISSILCLLTLFLHIISLSWL